MCGIVAVLSWDAPAPPLDAALVALAHRGPDGRGTWRSGDGRVALGHVRLAVRDLAGGAQPLADEEGKVVAVVNGELYSAELRRELVSLGHRFRAQTDSEVVVHAWKQWGPAMLPRLQGELAFALWDARDGVLFAARDRFGIKPLAWTEHGGSVMLASQARALFALGVPAAWDHASVLQASSLQYVEPDATLFEGVHQVPAGCALLARDGRVRITRYWDLDYPRTPRVWADEGAAVRAFRERFDDAVRDRLVADVPVAVQLSGGLDSSAVLASATRSAGRSFDAFTVSFTDDGGYDESILARQTADHLGARLHVLPVADREVAAVFPDAVVASEGACINAHAAAKLILSRAVRDGGFKVVLTGEGADEVLLGYAHLRSDIEGTSAGVAATNAASAGLMLVEQGRSPALAEVERVLGFQPSWLIAKASFGERVRALLQPSFVAGFGDRDPARTLLSAFDVAGQLEGRERVLQSSYLWTRLALEGYILRTLGDGLEMASGVEGRVPMLDDRLFAFIRELPTTMKVRGGVEKWVLREAMRGDLPEAVLRREKHPFLAPPMGKETLAAARDILASESFRGQPFFQPQRVTALLDELPAMAPQQRKLHDPVVFFVLSIAVLHARLGLHS